MNVRLSLQTLLCAWSIALAVPVGAVGMLADVTVYDRSTGATLPVYQHEGRYYVAGRPGNEYQVALRNTSGADLLAVLSVDGVDAVTADSDARFALLGASRVGEEALNRFYVLHCLAIPLFAGFLMAVHFWRVRKDGGISGPL
jgi:hypothetical protein